MHHFDIGARDLFQLHARTDEHVDVEAVAILGIGPGRHHQQGARDIAHATRTDVPQGAFGIDQGIGVAKALAVQGDPAQQGVVHGLLIEIGIFGVVIGQVELVLEEDQAAAGARLAIGSVAQRVVRPEAFRGLAAADAAGDIVLLVDHVVPQRRDRALVVDIAGFRGDIGHAGIEVGGAHGVADGFVLLDRRQVALVVFLAAPARIEQEAGQRDIAVAAPNTLRIFALFVVDEAAETDQRLLHLLVAVEPFLLAGPDIGDPAIGQLLGGVIQPQIAAVGQGVVVDRRFDEIAGGVAFVVAALFGRPAMRPGGAIGQGIGGLQVAVRLLG